MVLAALVILGVVKVQNDPGVVALGAVTARLGVAGSLRGELVQARVHHLTQQCDLGRAEDLRQVIDTVPDNRLLVETDAPYLAPTPHRGKTNQPAFVAHTADFWAARKEMEPEAFRALTGQNFLTLFSKVPGERVFSA